MSNQLVKRNPVEGYKNVFPKTFIDAIKDRESGASLEEIIQGFNMYFLSYNGNKALTRCKVPSAIRKEGLWITYVLYDHTVVTEWYNSDNIDDESWGSDSNWRKASNALVGDISISTDGYWIINGATTNIKAQGETGTTPLLRMGDNNKIQVTYDEGKNWEDISDYIVPKFRWNQGIGTTAGTIQISMDLGNTWKDLSNPITNNLRISKYIGINESLPASGVAEGTVYMKGPYYDENDSLNENPIYRMWVYAWKGNTLAWQDNGEFTSISAGVVQERGTSTTQVMSQDAVTRELTELESESEELSNAVNDITNKHTHLQLITPSFEWNVGFIENGNIYPYEGYRYSDRIEVEDGDVVKFLRNDSITPNEIRVISAYNGDALVDEKQNIIIGEYVIPNNVNNIVITIDYGILTSYGNVVQIERLSNTYSVKGIEEIQEVKDIINEVTEEHTYTENLMPSVIWSVGYEENGNIYPYDGYRYSNRIAVKEGDVVKNLKDDMASPNQIRVLTAYNGDSVIAEYSQQNISSEYVVPANIDGIVMTIDKNILTAYGNNTIIVRNNTELIAKGIVDLQEKIHVLYNKSGIWRDVRASIKGGNELILAERLDIKKGCQYSVNFKFDGAFDDNTTIVIGCGVDGYMSSRLIIAKDNIYTFISGNLYKTFAHGLTFSQFLCVNLEIPSTAANGAANIRINTLGGEFIVKSSNDTYFPNCNGKIFLRPSINVSDVTFSYAVTDLAYDAIVFGDSYVSLADGNRWPYFMMTRGNHRFALCGFGGAKSLDAIQSFREVASKKMPKFVIWALGMNDADGSSSVNSSWLGCIEEVRDWCSQNDRELILCTIPNVPSISHIYKNEYVRNSGNRYIDFAKAVDAEGAGASWYNGMLSSDGVHPTEAGAKALYYRILLDFPEIANL